MASNEPSVSSTVLWQGGDGLSETNLTQSAAKSNQTDYVERGLGLSVDGAADTVDIAAGHAIIQDGNQAYDVFPDAVSDLTLPNTASINYIYLAIQPGTDDDAYYHIDDTDDPPTDPSIKIGTADADAGTSTALNREPATDHQAIDVDDTGTDPSTAGELRRNGTELKAYSGGAVRNLSNIGSGGGGGSSAYRIVGVDDDSIQAAHDNASLGDTVYISSAYDESNETWPVNIGKELRILSSPQREIVPNADSSTDAFVIDHGGANNYPGARFEHVHVDAENGACDNIFKVQDARTVYFKGCRAKHAAGHGWSLGENSSIDVIGCHFINCSAEKNGGDGWYTTSAANGYLWLGCQAEENDGIGINHGNGTAGAMIQTTAELNQDVGIRLRGCNNIYVSGCYLEGNDYDDSDAQLVSETGINNVIDTCYINCDDISGNGSATTAVRLFEADENEVRSLYTRGASSGLIEVISSAGEDNDIHLASHNSYNDNPILKDDTGTRTRSDGTILPRDLSGVTGQYVGDRGIATNTTPGYLECVWTGTAWQPSDGSATF